MAGQWWLPRAVPWATAFPLPQDTANLLVRQGAVSENLGLAMDRLLAWGDVRGEIELVRELVDRSALPADFTRQAELFDAWQGRWHAQARALAADVFYAAPEWRVVVGLGTHKVLDGGLALHPTYGAPIMPASALKGVARLYAECVAHAPAERIAALFGEAESEARRGDLLFLDGIPMAPPIVERDVANPHYAAYYANPQNTPPADYIAPRPIFFLTVGRGSRFAFGVASLSHDAAAAAEGALWLQGALQDLGVGAKSSAGYGFWQIEEG